MVKTLYSILHRSLDLTDCFETKFIQSVKEMKKVERAFYLSLLFALFMLLLSYIGLLFRQRIFAWLFLGSLCAFCIILISFMGYLTYYRKRFKEMSRIRRVEKLELFDILLIQYGLDEEVKSRLLCKMLYNVFTISTYQN